MYYNSTPLSVCLSHSIFLNNIFKLTFALWIKYCFIATFGRFNTDKQYQEFSILCYVFIVVCLSWNIVSPIICPIARFWHLCKPNPAIFAVVDIINDKDAMFLWWFICLSEFWYVFKITLYISNPTNMSYNKNLTPLRTCPLGGPV